MAPEYPTMRETFKLEGRFGPGQPATQQQTMTGLRFDSSDGKYVFQAGIEGFTFSRLHPYEHWDLFEKEARRIWTIYRQYADPLHCIRAAVRYINRLDLSKLPVELKDYLRTYPEISPDMPQLMAGTAMQILIPQDNGVMLSLIEATVPPPSVGLASINLDLDFYKESQTEFATDEAIWTFLNSVRDIADRTFEGCITDKARELFEPVEV